MAGRDGAAPSRKGGRFEARVVADQVSLGRLAYRLRQAQGCAVDVVSVERCLDGHCTVNGPRVTHTFLIQAKSSGRLPAAEREDLIAEAGKVGACAVLAWPDGMRVRYEELARLAGERR